MSVPKQLQERVVTLMQSAKKGKQVSTWEEIVGELEKSGLAHTTSLPPSLVIVDLGSRNGVLVDPNAAHTLGAKIVRQGWSWKKASSATCAELPSDPADRAKVLAANPITPSR